MKIFRLIFTIFAAAFAGAALVKLGNLDALASLPGYLLFGVAVSAALASIGIYDYSRRFEPLRAKARLVRPALPSSGTPARRESCARSAA